MKATLHTVAPDKMRYATTGDWLYDSHGNLLVTVAEHSKNSDSAHLVALHEFLEAWFCRRAGIAEEDVSAFDLANPDAEEPGDLEAAPYHKEHQLATEVEKLICDRLGIDWDRHNLWVQEAGDAVEDALARLDAEEESI